MNVLKQDHGSASNTDRMFDVHVIVSCNKISGPNSILNTGMVLKLMF